MKRINFNNANWFNVFLLISCFLVSLDLFAKQLEIGGSGREGACIINGRTCAETEFDFFLPFSEDSLRAGCSEIYTDDDDNYFEEATSALISRSFILQFRYKKALGIFPFGERFFDFSFFEKHWARAKSSLSWVWSKTLPEVRQNEVFSVQADYICAQEFSQNIVFCNKNKFCKLVKENPSTFAKTVLHELLMKTFTDIYPDALAMRGVFARVESSLTGDNEADLGNLIDNMQTLMPNFYPYEYSTASLYPYQRDYYRSLPFETLNEHRRDYERLNYIEKISDEEFCAWLDSEGFNTESVVCGYDEASVKDKASDSNESMQSKRVQSNRVQSDKPTLLQWLKRK